MTLRFSRMEHPLSTSTAILLGEVSEKALLNPKLSRARTGAGVDSNI